MRRRAALLLLACALACRPPIQSTSALILFTQNQRLFLRADCEPGRGPCIPGPPVSATTYLSERYQNYRRSGYIDLDSDMRLRVIAPIMRPGSDGLALETRSEEPANTGKLNVNVRASSDLLGYETAIYRLAAADNGVVMGLTSLEAKSVSGLQSDLEKIDYLQSQLSSPHVFRLYFQLRRSDFDHDSALLIANSSAALDDVSRRFERDPNSICGAAAPGQSDLQCIALPHQAVMIAELGVQVQQRMVYLPVESNLEAAVRAYGEQDAKRLIPTLRVYRRVGAREIPIRFNRDLDEILRLPVAGGDRVEW